MKYRIAYKIAHNAKITTGFAVYKDEWHNGHD
jgi:hypothetical protein